MTEPIRPDPPVAQPVAWEAFLADQKELVELAGQCDFDGGDIYIAYRLGFLAGLEWGRKERA